MVFCRYSNSLIDLPVNNTRGANSFSTSCSNSDLSTISSNWSARSIASWARLKPSCSTTSSLMRMPAVSMMCTGRPSILISSDNRSLVVPGISVTIALSMPESAFKRLDLPAFGLPAITTLIPSFNSAPCLAWAKVAVIDSRIALSESLTLLSLTKSMSSSEKSIVASICTLASINSRTKFRILLENSPCKVRSADFAACFELDSIKSAIASAWSKSILLFRKARSENSPGLASRAPSCTARSSSCLST